MAWTDTTPCSFCGREVPIYKRFGNGQFCSKAHEESFLQQQNQLAVEVLHRTHDALKAYRPTSSSIEDILGLPTAKPPVPVALEVSEEPFVAPAEPAPVAFRETLADEEPPVAGEQLQQLPEGWLAPPTAEISAEESREFDVAASVTLPRLAGFAPEEAERSDAWEVVAEVEESAPLPAARPTTLAMDRSVFHFGDSIGKLQEYGFLSSLRRLWESLTARRALR